MHFYSRRYLQTRFDLRNCNAMCAGCNRRHNEDPGPYLRFMNERYGGEAVADLDRLRRDGAKSATRSYSSRSNASGL